MAEALFSAQILSRAKQARRCLCLPAVSPDGISWRHLPAQPTFAGEPMTTGVEGRHRTPNRRCLCSWVTHPPGSGPRYLPHQRLT